MYEILQDLKSYGSLFTNAIYLLAFGLLIIYILNRIATKLIYPHLKNKRAMHVIFGASYVLVLAVTVLMVLSRMGYDITSVKKLTLLTIAVGSVIIFFLIPFLPRLPFKVGQMVEVGGFTGIVDQMNPYHTSIRTFDGKIVFIPNARLFALYITNFHLTPTRRIELMLRIEADGDLAGAKKLLLELMSSDARVIDDPAPAVYVMNVNAEAAQMSGYCWVNNSDFLGAQSDLWTGVVDGVKELNKVTMALSTQKILLQNDEPRK